MFHYLIQMYLRVYTTQVLVITVTNYPTRSLTQRRCQTKYTKYQLDRKYNKVGLEATSAVVPLTLVYCSSKTP